MTKRISELPAVGSVGDADEFELNESGSSRKATRAQLVAGLATVGHGHDLAEITDAGALAARDSVGSAEIEAAAFASQAEAVAGTDNARIMTPLRTAEAIAAQPPAGHQHALDDITGAGALAGLEVIGIAQIEAAAYASQAEAAAGTDNAKLMSALRTAEAIAAQAAAQGHQHEVAEITDAGALATLDTVGTTEIEANAVTSDKVADHAIISSKLGSSSVTQDKIATGAVTNAKLADDAVTQAKIADNAIGAAQLQDGIPISMQGALLSDPELRGYAETSPAPAVGSGTLTLDLATGNVFEVILTEDVISLILANAPAAGRAGSCSLILKQDATGGRTLIWPAAIRWADGAPPTITSAANAVDVYALVTTDGGATWFGFPGGQDFS